MDFPKFLLFLILLVFTAFSFPKLNDAIESISLTETLRPLFLSVPYIFLVAFISATIYYGFKGK